ncbi:ribosomal oxygenase 1-like [Macrosteles quadrilineatus]|uniref:ribosomal oxygenase 1-like n=1 Tax=Macrosteles quadrilineatus TaxID=74068 RepID=UPI0023E15365|nr:ribosomal oxygenase 1-like [Macrosteles quadrilineatus]
MKVSTEPVSAFAIYSEKLKQKKKKSKPLLSNGVNKVTKAKVGLSNGVAKVKKSQVSTLLKKQKNSNDNESWQMKEIGYILKTLAERSTETSSPRAAALLDSINEANEKLEHDDNNYLEDTLHNVIMIENLKDTVKNLKRKKTNKFTPGKSADSCSTKGPGTSKDTDSLEDLKPLVLKTTTSPTNKEESSASRSKSLKKLKTATKEQGHSTMTLDSKSQNLDPKKKQPKVPKETKLNKKNIKKVGMKSDNNSKGKSQKHLENSDTTARLLFEWLTAPVLEKDFMRDYWEKKPLLIQREGHRHYFSELLSTEIIDTMLRENNVCFTKHLDVTSYTDGVRETHNLTGRAQANVVWDFYSNGCSVRLLNPQIFLPKIHTLNATLQEYFGCFVGANVYLTPPNSQGFAPHYDDIEAFVLQIEGKKRWKIYTPRNEAEVLPRFSSPNFTQEEVGDSFLDVTLEPGDLLYFPRGFIHQASTPVEGHHSLHITLSAYQKTAWVDLLEKALPLALKKAAENDVEFRRGLPRDYLGLEHHGSVREKQTFVSTAHSLMEKLSHYLQLSLGAGVDLMGAQFMHDALPPVFTPEEKLTSSVGGGLKMKNGKLKGRVEFQMETCVKLIRHNICRMVEEEGEVRLYHCLYNSLEYHGEDPQFLLMPAEGIPVITHLQAKYPGYTSLRDIPHQDPEDLITLISDLWDAGLLSAKNLPVVEEN